MEEEQNSQDKILKLLTNNYKIVLIAILFFGLYLRLKYVNINTAVWWDEGEYLSIAKQWAFGINYEVPSVRQPLIPFLVSIMYRLGISSIAVIKFFVVTIPSIISVYLTYLLGKEMYNKKIGLISSFMMSVFWVSLFWSSRVSTDLLGITFSLLAFWAFYKGYMKGINPKKYLTIAGIALALGFTTRVGNVLTILILGLYLLIIARFKIFKDKPLRYLIAFSVIAILPYLVYNQIRFGNPLAFWGLYFSTVSAATSASAPFFWGFFKFFKIYLNEVFYIFFLIGLLTFYKLILGFDLLIKKKDKVLSSDLLVLLMIIIPTIYFAFIQRQVSTEPRWAMVMAPAIFFVTAKGFILLYNLLVKYIPIDSKKVFSLVVVVLLIIWGASSQTAQAESLIEGKKDSYAQLKDAGLWMKENSEKDDIVLSSAIPQNSYYSERKTIQVHGKEADFNRLVAELRPTFLEITILEGYPDWAYDWPSRHEDILAPVQAYHLDEAKTQLAVVVFQFHNDFSNPFYNLSLEIPLNNPTP